MTIRPATPADRDAFARIFVAAIRHAGPQHYAPDQVAAWSAGADDTAAFGKRMLRHRSFVADAGGDVIGFVALEPDGCVRMLYVHPDHHRKGVGQALLARVEQESRSLGVDLLYAQASAFALGAFLRAGYVQTGADAVEREGVRFTRALVEKRLAA